MPDTFKDDNIVVTPFILVSFNVAIPETFKFVIIVVWLFDIETPDTFKDDINVLAPFNIAVTYNTCCGCISNIIW